MSETQAPAAGQSGTEIAPQPAAAGPKPDDAYRHFAVEELAVQLARGSALLAQCEAIAKTADDGVGPIREAARLMNANAQIAKALARLVECRSTTIVAANQKLDPEIAGLNVRFPAALEGEILRMFELRLQQVLTSQAARAIACST